MTAPWRGAIEWGMLSAIAEEIKSATLDREKTAMIHFQILLHADQLEGMDASEFCTAVGIEEAWAAEFRKMVRLGKFMQERGYALRQV